MMVLVRGWYKFLSFFLFITSNQNIIYNNHKNELVNYDDDEDDYIYKKRERERKVKSGARA
jgi:hypothetical protein